MATNNKNNNDTVIKQSFAKFRANVDMTIQQGLITMLRTAKEHAFALHEEQGLHNHLEMGDSYGYGLWHNGKMVDSVIYGNTENALSNAQALINGYNAPSSGWVGVLFAGSSPAHFFIFEKEDRILDAVALYTEHSFNKFFKKV